MTLEQRAQQFWSLLVFAAKEQKLVSYSMLARITGFYEAPGPVLYCIHCYCKQYDFPPLNAIVVDPSYRPPRRGMSPRLSRMVNSTVPRVPIRVAEPSRTV